jgi:aryl-alcohol dehydrogenase-like predicted oxidoreductase
MKTRKLGRTGLQVSEIGFGALEIGRAWGLPVEGDFAVPTEREVQSLLDRVLELGINLIDTAPAYMLSEERIGKLLKHRRKEFHLATKCGEHFDGYDSQYDFSTAGTLQFIESSLRRLETDYVDLIQIHCGPDEEETIRRGEALEGMLRAKRDGKVRWVGVSCHAEGARVALDLNAYDVLQLPYSLLNRSIEGEVLSRAAQAQVGILVRGALGRGHLTEKVRHVTAASDPNFSRARAVLANMEARGVKTPLSHLAIQFALRDPRLTSVLVGTRSARHLEDAVAAAANPLDPSLLSALDAPSFSEMG